jgi:hypothetical protein
MCEHHDPRWGNACREERAEAPRSKETANFCDWFKPRPGAWDGPAQGKAQVARSALDALFGEAPAGSEPGVTPSNPLDALFSDPTKGKD